MTTEERVGSEVATQIAMQILSSSRQTGPYSTGSLGVALVNAVSKFYVSRQSGWGQADNNAHAEVTSLLDTWLTDQIAVAIDKARADEREACAKVVEDSEFLNMSESAKIAAAIRARP